MTDNSRPNTTTPRARRDEMEQGAGTAALPVKWVPPHWQAGGTGLWNQRHVEEKHDTMFLDDLEKMIERPRLR